MSANQDGSSSTKIRATLEVETADIKEIQDLVQELKEAQSAAREIGATRQSRVRTPETGQAPIRTEAFEDRGCIFGGETGKEEKFRDKGSRAAIQKENQFSKMRDQVEELQETQGGMMNSLINLGFTGGIGAGFAGNAQQKIKTGSAAVKSTAKGGFLGGMAGIGTGIGGLKGMMAMGGIYGMIALAAIEVGQSVIEMMIAPGGLWDRRFKRDIGKEEVKMFDLREKEEINQGRRIIRVTTSSGLRGTTDQVRSNLDYYKQGKRIFDLDGTLITYQTGVGSI